MQRSHKRKANRSHSHARGMVHELFDSATSAHRAGDLGRARELYRRVLAMHPRHAEAIHLLGFAEFQSSQFADAIEHLQSATQLAPKNAEFRNNLALALLAAGDFPAAGHHALIAKQLGHSDGHGYLHIGWESFQRREFDAAESAYRISLTVQPQNPDAHHFLGILFAEQRNWAEAAECFEAALRENEGFVAAMNNLGNAFRELGRVEEAIPLYRRACDIDPTFVAAHINLGIAFVQVGDLDSAIQSYDRALRLQPDSVEAVNNLANALGECGQLAEAISQYHRALQLQPRSAEIYCNLGAAWKRFREPAKAIDCFRRAAMLQPSSEAAYQHLGAALNDLGRADEAARCYIHLADRGCHRNLFRLSAAACCPTVFDSPEEARAFTRQLSDELELVEAAARPLNWNEVAERLPFCPFALQFLEGNLRPIKEQFARAIRGWLPRFPQSRSVQSWPGPRRTPRIGIVVTDGHEGIFLKSLEGVLQRLSPRYEVLIFASHRGAARVRIALARPGLTVVPTASRLQLGAQQISEAECDLLYYWEVGTDQTNYLLPFLRLAPIQVTSWGVQVTSGISTIDAYLSSRLVEPDGASASYSERLHQADSLLTYRVRAAIDQNPADRGSFPVPANRHWYVCAHQPGKLHVQFDPILAQILRRDLQGELLLIADQSGTSVRSLTQRFAHSMPDVADRVHFLPRLESALYWKLLAAADVLLDPHHFGGVNSTYDALSIGKPIIVWPSDQHRGRYSYGCYRKMGMLDCVADSADCYVELALSVASDEGRRNQLRQRIFEASSALFDDGTSVTEHERLFEVLFEEHRRHAKAG